MYKLVTLEVTIGEMSYPAYHLIRGVPDMDTAVKRAINDESRSSLEWDGDDAAFDLNGELYIQALRVEDISEEEYQILDRHL